MKLDEIITKLIELDEDTCPCEVGIPCSFFNPNNKISYCDTWCRCAVGVKRYIQGKLKSEEEEA